jgi:hypothetical protein
MNDSDQSDPVHEAIIKARGDSEHTASDLLWLGLTDPVVSVAGVKSTERMSDVWPERWAEYRRICGR